MMEKGLIRRLDRRSLNVVPAWTNVGEGAGLGLAIVLDVLEAYGWRLVLDTSDLGGLKAVITPGAEIDRAKLDALF